ncbi:hypothetical protein A8B74_18945 [Sulfitobacter geojensis]|nr:hypothetical protein A8B74_18945 [Sulfitobacter geojensis]
MRRAWAKIANAVFTIFSVEIWGCCGVLGVKKQALAFFTAFGCGAGQFWGNHGNAHGNAWEMMW